MVLDLKELKDILQTEVMERMDHRHLNYEVPELVRADSDVRKHRGGDLEVARTENQDRQAGPRAAV